MRAAAVAPVCSADCRTRADSSEQDRVAQAFVVAAIRLAPTLRDRPGPFSPNLIHRRRGCLPGDLSPQARP